MKTIHDFILHQFNFSSSHYNLNGSSDLTEQLYSLVTNSAFRRTAVDSQSVKDIKEKIGKNVSAGIPVSFSIPFGAYKNWHLPSYPEPDWAEIFNLNYLIRYAIPICSIYPPGVQINYSYTDDVMDIVSNLPKAHQEKYVAAFKMILAYFRKNIPGNLRLELVKINDFYSPNEFRNELERNFEHNLLNWEAKYPQNIRDYKVESARHNFVLNGVIDMNNQTADELGKIYLRSAMWCDALDCLEKRRQFNKYSNNIQIIFVKGPSLSLHLGVCETAGMHFWVGSGIAEQRQSRWLQRIFSHAKVNSFLQSGELERIKTITDLSAISSNYRDIPVWNNSILK